MALGAHKKGEETTAFTSFAGATMVAMRGKRKGGGRRETGWQTSRLRVEVGEREKKRDGRALTGGTPMVASERGKVAGCAGHT